MKRQHAGLSLIVLLLTTPPAYASGVTPVTSSADTRPEQRPPVVDFDLKPDYYYAPETSWADSVMMTKLPPGSLVVQYDGPQKLLIKHARSQVRRYARRYRKYSDGEPTRLNVWNNEVTLDGWWNRTWLESRPADKGGAPAKPYIHTVGKELTWRFGPLTISNMLRVKLDYFAVFKLNPDPGEETGDRNPPPVSLDVKTTRSATFGTKVKFKVRPDIRIGMPKSDGWLSALRSIAVRANFEVVLRGIRVIRGDIVLKYKPGDDLSLQFGMTIGDW